MEFYLDVFPTRPDEASLANIFVNGLSNVTGITNIRQLADADVEKIGVYIQRKQDSFKASLVDLLKTEISSVQSDNPNFTESQYRTYTLGRFSDELSVAYNVLCDRLLERGVVADFMGISSVSNSDIIVNFGSYPTDPSFIYSLSSYYISKAKEAVTLNSRSHTIFLKLTYNDLVPLSSATVFLTDTNEFSSIRRYAGQKSNEEGYIGIEVSSVRDSIKLDLEVLSPGETNPANTLSINPSNIIYDGTTDNYTISASYTPAVEYPSAPIIGDDSIASVDLAGFSSLDALEEISSHFTDLRAIRNVGGAQNAPISWSDATMSDLVRIDAYANLETASPKPANTKVLIDTDVMNFSSIAQFNRSAFIDQFQSATSGSISNVDLGRIYTASKTAYTLISSAVSDTLAKQDTAIEDQDFVTALPKQCSCRECQSGVSPLAYLADLIKYTRGNVKADSNMASLSILVSKLNQQFADLPAACSEVENEICRGRIVIEVLNGYLNNNEYVSPTHSYSQTFKDRAAQYRLAVYESILVSVGTSYEEIRSARLYDDQKKQELADRIGIPLYPTGSSNTSLEDLLKINFTNNTENMDRWLEEMFGLRNMFRSPVNNPSSVPTYSSWRKEKLREIWSKQDHPEDIFSGEDATYPIIDPDLIDPDDIHDAIAPSLSMDLWKHRRDNQDNHIFSSSYLSPIKNNIKGYPGVSTLIVLNDDIASDLNEIKEFKVGAGSTFYNVEYAEEKKGDTYLRVSNSDYVNNVANNDTITIEGIEKTALFLQNFSPFDEATFKINGDFSAVFTVGFNLEIEVGANTSQATVDSSVFDYNEEQTFVNVTLSSPFNITNDQDGRITYNRSATVGNRSTNDFDDMLAKMEFASFEYPFNAAIATDPSSSTSQVVIDNEDLTKLLTTPLLDNLLVEAETSPSSWEGMNINTVTYSGGQNETTIDLSSLLSAPPSNIRITVRIRPWDGLNVVGDLYGSNNLVSVLQTGTSSEIEATKSKIIDDYKLTVESFTRLANLYSIYYRSENDYNEPELTTEEWFEVRNILISAIKQYYVPYFIQEEQLNSNSITLSPKLFKVATTRPLPGLWPMIQKVDEPLIDPQLIDKKELPNYPYGTKSGQKAIVRYDAAKTDLETALDDISGASSFLGSMQEVWGTPISLPSNVSDVIELRDNLFSNNPYLVGQAQDWIEDEYKITQLGFEKIVEIYEQDIDVNPANKPTSAEYQTGYNLLLKSKKFRDFYPSWYSDEQTDTYYELRKAKLPEWKVTLVTRILWERALEKKSSSPIVDPDVIEPTYFAEPTYGVVFDIWTTRRAWVDSQMSAIESTWTSGGGTEQDKFQVVIDTYFGDYSDDFLRLMDDYNRGIDIEIPLSHFSILFREFNRLHEIDNLLDSTSLLESEKQEIFQILTAVNKRKEFAAWRNEEESNGITLRPELFKLPVLGETQFPIDSNSPELTPYLASYSQLKGWTDKLDGRIEQYESVDESLKEAVTESFESITEFLIAVFVEELPSKSGYDGPNTTNLEELREWCNERFLIDVKNNCCQKTNRISQAIETLQQLIWGLRTDVLENDTPTAPFYNWRLYTDNFDEEWKWIGSYGSWRSAMFTFLYPENLTAPHLKRDSSPAFEKLIDQTLNNNRFNPQLACEAAKEYNRYFEDVCELEIKATCYDIVTPPEWSECSGKEQPKGYGGYRKWNFYFADSKVSDKLYWSYVDDSNEESVAQSYWMEIPHMEEFVNVKLIGAASRQKDFRSMTVHVFFTAQVGSEDHFFFIVYDRKKHQWGEVTNLGWDFDDGNLVTLAFDQFVHDVNLTLASEDDYQKVLSIFRNRFFATGVNTRDMRIFVAQDSATFREPSVYIEVNGFIFERFMNSSFDSWDDRGWVVCSIPLIFGTNPNNLPFDVSIRLVSVSYCYSPDVVVVCLKRKDGVQLHYRRSGKSWNDKESTNILGGVKRIVGFIPSDFVLNAGVYYNQRNVLIYQSNQGLMYAYHHGNKGGILGSFLHLTDIEKIPSIDGGRFINNRWTAVKLRSQLNSTLWSRGVFNHPSSGQISNISSFFALTPSPSSYKKIESRLTSAQLRANKGIIQQAYLNNSQNYQGVITMPRHLELVQEAFFFIPMHIGNQLVSSEDYVEALDWIKTVYDYSQDEPSFTQDSDRKIYYGLVEELYQANTYQRSPNWLLDPLNPHAIAESRTMVYNKYVIMSLVQAILAYADSLYTMDTVETVPKARQLYDTALELLELINYHPNDCQKKIASIDVSSVENISWRKVIEGEIEKLHRIFDLDLLNDVIDGGGSYTGIKNILANGSLSDQEKAVEIENEVSNALASLPSVDSISLALGKQQRAENVLIEKFLTNPYLDDAAQIVRDSSFTQFDNGIVNITGYTSDVINGSSINFDWLKDNGSLIDFSLPEGSFIGGYPSVMRQNVVVLDPENSREEQYKEDGVLFLSGAFSYGSIWAPGIIFNFCVPKNPIIDSLTLKAELNLFKIRNCMNIAGMHRELDPFAAPTDTSTGIPFIGASGNITLPGAVQYKPTPFRYEFLVVRAKQLISIAQQTEAAMLASLEKWDQERYSQMRARQDLQVAKSQLKLQDLRVNEAKSGVDLAELQKERAEINSSGLEDLINQGLTKHEEAMLSDYLEMSRLLNCIAWSIVVQCGADLYLQYKQTKKDAKDGGLDWDSKVAYIGAAASILTRSVTQFYLQDAQLRLQSQQIHNSVLRQQQNWQLQQSLSNQDIKIGNQQIKIAQQRVKVVAQEKKISELQVSHAEDTLEFLQNKFTNADLYAWMSRQLEKTYSYFLQEATGVAQLAQGQLAYERQEAPAEFIQSDYWESPKSYGSFGGETVDRKGLTGSSRLLQDLTKLDQYAFTTEERRLQLSKTLSLSALFPIQFEELRKSGKMTFQTLMEWFDRDYPGHYHRLIKSVRVTVIALSSPGGGIKATLSNSGLSKVVVGDTFYQSTYVRTQPDQIALSSGIADSGLIELSQDNRLLMPFEGVGVESTWEFRMEKASNPFDYESLADVLITIDYEALNSFTYRAQVIGDLNNTIESDLAFSFINNFPDQWYDFANANGNTRVQLITLEGMLPPNISDARIRHISMLFDYDTSDTSIIVENVDLAMGVPGNAISGKVNPVDGIASTRTGSAATWSVMIGEDVAQAWELELNQNICNLIKDGKINDIIWVISYKAETTPFNV